VFFKHIDPIWTGLTRAILDTFPIVKFGTVRDPESESKMQETIPPNPEFTQPNLGEGSAPPLLPPIANAGDSEPGPLSIPSPLDPNIDLIPAAIGRETCPICIVDFEQGDDLRVLPCDGAHRFHQTCVDPLLLELSTCPICRQGAS
jgi:hypothetical protein